MRNIKVRGVGGGEKRKGLPGPSSIPILGLGVALQHVHLENCVPKLKTCYDCFSAYVIYDNVFFKIEVSAPRDGVGKEGLRLGSADVSFYMEDG